MKMIFLVDGDNNIGTGLQGIDLLTAEDTVLVFFGKGQTLANVKKLCAGTKAQVQYLESVKGGKNSLDFQIITELGVLVGRGEADFAYVISQDKGYEAAMSALHARYASTFREVALRPSIQDCLQAAFLLRAGTREELAAAQPQPQPEPPAAGEEAEESPEEGENSQAALIMAHVRRYLEDNYMFDLSLDSVGEILHISPAYLSAQFKKYQKMNFLDCLTELRINAAKELLTDPFRSSAEVASMVGYEDASYFARAFKKRTGMTPTQYRRQAGQKAKSDPEAEL